VDIVNRKNERVVMKVLKDRILKLYMEVPENFENICKEIIAGALCPTYRVMYLLFISVSCNNFIVHVWLSFSAPGGLCAYMGN
jgi:hypothetical protein